MFMKPSERFYELWCKDNSYYRHEALTNVLKQLDKEYIKILEVTDIIKTIFNLQSSWKGFLLRGEKDLYIIKDINLKAKEKFHLEELKEKFKLK